MLAFQSSTSFRKSEFFNSAYITYSGIFSKSPSSDCNSKATSPSTALSICSMSTARSSMKSISLMDLFSFSLPNAHSPFTFAPIHTNVLADTRSMYFPSIVPKFLSASSNSAFALSVLPHAFALNEAWPFSKFRHMMASKSFMSISAGINASNT